MPRKPRPSGHLIKTPWMTMRMTHCQVWFLLIAAACVLGMWSAAALVRACQGILP